MLALQAGAAVEREWLAALLWPESTGPLGLSNLRNSLRDLRQALGPEAGRLRSPAPRTLSLDVAGVEIDVLAFDQAIARGDAASLEQAITLYRGPLLAGCVEEWAFQERQIREQAYLQALEKLAERALDASDATQAERHLRRAISVEPLRETAHRALMRVLAAGGNYAAAVLVYRELREYLHREINAQPDPETQALFHQLRTRARGGARAAETLHAGFSPLDSEDPLLHNLPAQVTPLVGREREVAAVRDLIGREAARLVTLTGPGGTGKTRVGLQVAAGLYDPFPDGVFFVDLAPITEPALVVSAIAHTLGLRETAGHPLLESLKKHLRAKQLLLLLDNFEQVLSAAPLVSELLAACPRLKVLVTSRTILHVRGEHEFPVPPLALPDPKRLSVAGADRLSALSQYAAVELFVQRAVAARPDFAITNENAPAVAEICVRLDGLPLAIELAAARIRLFPPQALLLRLGNPLDLLTGGARDLPARQQTLRNTITWSCALLDEGEKRLFRCLSVFRGGFTADAAEAVGSNSPPDTDPAANPHAPSTIRSPGIVDRLVSLAEKSLLRLEEKADGEPRFSLLETIREYGLEQLDLSGEVDAIRRRHARYFLALAEKTEPQLRGPEQAICLERLEAEHDNLRAALAWSVAAVDLQLGLRIGGALSPFWDTRGYMTEGRERLLEILAVPGAEARTAARAKALRGVGELAYFLNDYAGADAMLEESLEISRQLGDTRSVASSLVALSGIQERLGDYAAARSLCEEAVELSRAVRDDWSLASALIGVGFSAREHGDYETARSCYQESLSLFRKAGDKVNVARMLRHLGVVSRQQGDLGLARSLGEEALSLDREQGHQLGIATSLARLGDVARCEGDDERATLLYEQSLARYREMGSTTGISRLLHDLGQVALHEREHGRAQALLAESLILRRETKNKKEIAECLAGLAGVATARQQARRAARLLATSAALLKAVGIVMERADHTEYEQHLAAVRAALGESAFAAAWAEGWARPVEEAVADALEEGNPALRSGPSRV